MGNESRLYALKEGETYVQAVERLSFQDRNAYGQKHMSIAARVKNEVTAVSRIDTTPGSDMFSLSSYISHSLARMYSAIQESDASEESKIKLANAVKDIEQVAARFAQSVDLRRKEQKEREKKCKQNTTSASAIPTESEKQSARSLLGSLLALFR